MSLQDLYNKKRKFNTLFPPTVELCQTNSELRQELDREVKINIENETKIKCLEKQLGRYENQILYLNNLIEKFESQEKSNREELTNLQLELKKSNTIYEERGKYILFQESNILELQEVIYKLKERIHIMAQSSPQRRNSNQPPIQPPILNEYNGIYDDISDSCRDIDDFIQDRPEAQSMNKMDIVNNLNIIAEKVQRFCEISQWSEQKISRLNDQVTQLQAQQQNQVTQLQAQQQNQIVLLQTDLARVNNNFNILNQAHNFQTHRLQITDGKYNKWKRKAKTGPSFIWIINFPSPQLKS